MSQDPVSVSDEPAGNGIINLMGGIGALISFGGLSLVYDHDPRLAFGLGTLALFGTGVVVLLKADRHPPYVEAPAVSYAAAGGDTEPERPRPGGVHPDRVRRIIPGVRVGRRHDRHPLRQDPHHAHRPHDPAGAVPVGGTGPRVRIIVGLYYLFTMVGNMVGPSIIGGAMDLFGDQGLFYGSAAASAAGFVLLRRGQRLLPAAPEDLARRSVELPTN